ncbi:conserve protein having a signal peptide [Cryptosporidium ryanae]|uniref:conserve protein having a signal peptide n=1 Tax=Cryptosporidium ryanae TaxID=515981 RepID=UPI00351A9A44|nr:conserve protein having a signal peptide [Cryptosporidium ryanae]
MKKEHLKLVLSIAVLFGVIFTYTFNQCLLVYKTKNRVNKSVFLDLEADAESTSNKGRGGYINGEKRDWSELRLEYKIVKDGITTRKEYKIYLYSAYLDTRIKNDGKMVGIRVNGLVPNESDDNIAVGCMVSVNSKGYSKEISGKTRIFIHKEHHNKEFVAATIYCDADNSSEFLKEDVDFGLSVTITVCESNDVQNFSKIELKVKSTFDPDNGNKKINLSICIRPWWGEPVGKSEGQRSLRQKFDNIGLLFEFINAYVKLGVGRIYMYENYLELSDDVLKLIKYYSEEKELVELVPFKIPILPFKQVWDFAQTTMIQDCLLRNLNKSEYLLFVDTDEFVFPTNSKYDLRSYFKLLDSKKNSNNIGALWVPMYFHFLEWDSDLENENKYKEIESKIANYHENVEFVLYRKTCRMNKSGTTKGEKARRKVIVKPDKVLYMGIHEPEEMLNDHRFIKSPIINDEEGVINNSTNTVGLILHHYRKATGLVNNDPKQRELFSMYLNNNCSFHSNPNTTSQTTTIDKIVWDLFGTEIYYKILDDIINIKSANNDINTTLKMSTVLN